MSLVATNVVASRLAEGQPTGTPTACANLKCTKHRAIEKMEDIGEKGK